MSEVERFTCEDVFRRLDDYLDRELSAEEMEQVADHLEACAQCAQEQRFEARVLETIRGKLRHLQAPDLLIKRVAKILEQERKRAG
jgi:anti-sigma factor (TIGR02949 family)